MDKLNCFLRYEKEKESGGLAYKTQTHLIFYKLKLRHFMLRSFLFYSDFLLSYKIHLNTLI